MQVCLKAKPDLFYLFIGQDVGPCSFELAVDDSNYAIHNVIVYVNHI